MNRLQQKLLDDARLLNRFVGPLNPESTLALSIQRFVKQQDERSEDGLQHSIQNDLQFLQTLKAGACL